MNLNKTLSPLQAADQLDRYFRKLHAKHPDLPLQVRVHSGKLGLDYTFPGDSSGQPYHVASIGKLLTASLVMMLAERGVFTTRDPIHPFFSSAELERLFVFQGADYARQVTIEQLLGHTSGLADYFEGGVTGGRTFLDEVLANPQAHWTPQALLEFTREKQAAVGAPGQVFNYSDTGYILLGLLIERVSGRTFHENLMDEFFLPLEMDDSYLMFYSKPTRTPTKALEEIWFNGVEISGFESLSCDWAGGGIVSTPQDLLKFSRALREGRLVQPAALARMDTCTHKFQPGIYYGLGMMEIRFKEFFFLLGRLPKVKGHIGILATHLFYDPLREAHIVLNFGSNKRMVESFKALIQVENILARLA